jgi:putative transposase
VSRFIDAHRGRFGVEPICSTLGVSASAYYYRGTGERSRRAVEDEWLLEQIERVHAANWDCYGYRRTWLQPSARASGSAATESSG